MLLDTLLLTETSCSLPKVMASNLMLQLSGYLTAGVVRDGVFAGTVESEVLGEEVERGEDVNTPLPGEPEIQIKL